MSVFNIPFDRRARDVERGQIIRDADFDDWDVGQQWVMVSGEPLYIVLIWIGELINPNVDSGEDTESDVEPDYLKENPALWSTIYFEFVEGQRVSLADVINNPDLWPVGYGIVCYLRGARTKPSNIVGAILKGVNGFLLECEEKQMTFAKVPVVVTGGSDLRDHSFGRIGTLDLDYAAVSEELQRLAATVVDDQGQPAPVANPAVALYISSLVRQGSGETDPLPDRPVTITDAESWGRLQEIVRGTKLPLAAVDVYGIDLAKIPMRSWTEANRS